MEQLKEFVVKYFKIIVVVLSFSLTLYIQHVNNTAQTGDQMYRFGSGNQEPV
jgi:hypothetical protein